MARRTKVSISLMGVVGDMATMTLGVIGILALLKVFVYLFS